MRVPVHVRTHVDIHVHTFEDELESEGCEKVMFGELYQPLKFKYLCSRENENKNEKKARTKETMGVWLHHSNQSTPTRAETRIRIITGMIKVNQSFPMS